jgi:hypothetical protein
MSGKKTKRKTAPLPVLPGNKKKKTSLSNDEENKEEEEQEEEVPIGVGVTAPGLSEFIARKTHALNELKRTRDFAPNAFVEIVLWEYNGTVFLLPVRIEWQELVTQIVDTTNYIHDGDRNDSFEKKLADSLFYLYNKAPAFFDTMSMLGPIDSAHGGYHLLQLFLVFLKEDQVVESDKKLKAGRKKLRQAMRDSMLMRKLMKE